MTTSNWRRVGVGGKALFINSWCSDVINNFTLRSQGSIPSQRSISGLVALWKHQIYVTQISKNERRQI